MKQTLLSLFLLLTSTISHADLSHLRSAIQLINDHYVDEINPQKLQDGAIEGILQSFDPHSQYLDQQSLSSLHEQTSGNFTGIGVEIEFKDHILSIITPLDNSPAKKAGILPGDRITAINKQPTSSMKLMDIINAIRGEKNTNVTLSIARDHKHLDIDVRRDFITPPNVSLTYPSDHTAVIRIASFNEQTMPQLLEAIDDIKTTPKVIHGLILDLRDNPGGLLNSAIETADTFLDAKLLSDNKKIVYIKGKNDNSVAYATEGAELKGLPIVVLINEGSASGAEIVALALQEHNRAVILGKQSFGKGSVQSIIPIDQHSAMKLTTALYYSPRGKSIQATGVTPDVQVDLRERSTNTQTQTILKEADLTNAIPSKNQHTKVVSEQQRSDDPYIEQAKNLLKAHYALRD